MRGSRVLAVLGAAVLLGVSGGVGFAVANPGDPPVIIACAAKSNGAMRLLTTGHCKSTEIAIDWNQQGVPGRNGTNGTDLSTQLYSATNTSGGLKQVDIWESNSLCDAGDTVLGADSYFANGTVDFTRLQRVVIDGRAGMQLEIHLDNPLQTAVFNGQVIALCLDVDNNH